MQPQLNNNLTIRLSGIVEDSIVDGEGLRTTIFVQGCPHKCKGCHNPHTHDMGGGKDFLVEDVCSIIKNNPLISGVTFSGGEPFCQVMQLIEIANFTKNIGKNIWCYTGYTHEDLIEKSKTDTNTATLLSLIDVLVDGPFIESQKDLTLKFKGSKNQRIIKLK